MGMHGTTAFRQSLTNSDVGRKEKRRIIHSCVSRDLSTCWDASSNSCLQSYESHWRIMTSYYAGTEKEMTHTSLNIEAKFGVRASVGS
jgi:hypothetical protein